MASYILSSAYDFSLSLASLDRGLAAGDAFPTGTVDSRFSPKVIGLAQRRVSPYNRAMTTGPIESDTSDTLLSAVGRRVQQLRETKGLKPGEFARLAGVTQQYLWRLEDGQQNLNLRSISRLAIALDVPMTALLEGIDPDPSTVEKRPYRKPAGT
jgi:ribosome-binding protein aMBF1 (putative translation factor)